jgi:hypothetical protein
VSGFIVVFVMSARPRAGRAGTGRDNKDGDVETELLNRVIDAVRRAKEHNDNCRRLGEDIMALEEEIKLKGSKFSGPSPKTTL